MFLNRSFARLRQRTCGLLLTLRNRHFLALDLALFVGAPVFALILRTDSAGAPARYAPALLIYIALALTIRTAVNHAAGLYQRFWRYAGLGDFTLIGVAVLLASGLLALAELVVGLMLQPALPALTALPRSIPLIESLLVLFGLGAVRLAPRLADQYLVRAPDGSSKRIAIVGAGQAGVTIVREIQRNPHLGLHVVCFFDDDPRKHNTVIQGVRVCGGRNRIAAVAAAEHIQEVILAMPTAPGKTIQEIVQICQGARLSTRTIPGIYELIDGRISVNQLRRVDLADLLRRPQVETDRNAVRTLLRGKRVLVTGGGGSIGRELCRQVLACEPAALILLGHGENSIFEATRELERLCAQRGLANVAIRPLIADVRFGDRIRHLFAEVKPDVVFHAAAHKHVPLMEANPSEAITNNVLGTRNVVNAAVAAGVGRLVMISTDKAVNPTSVMGASKRTAEMVLMQAAHRHNLPYVAVRFGNVLGSRGSVVPIFQRQIAEGGPITVTDPEMRRYFMTIPEAVQLVLQAAVLGQRGEIFVLDMGEQVRIRDMAEALVRLSGLEVGRDIDIIYTGLRPGEKLYEELFVASEAYVKTAHGKVFMASNGAAAVPTDLDAFIDALAASAQRYDDAAIIRCLGALIPGYQPLSRSEPCPHHPGHCPAQSGRAKPCPPGAASASAD